MKLGLGLGFSQGGGVLDVFRVNNYIEGFEDSTANTATITLPSGIKSGDLIVIIASNDSAQNGERLSIAGFTKEIEAGGASQDAHVAFFWKTATGGETTATLSHDTNFAAWVAMRIPLANASPINGTSTSWAGGSSIGVLGVTTTVDNCLVFTAFAGDGADTDPISITGTGWSAAGQLSSPEGDSASGVGFAWGFKTVASAGSAENSTGTLTGFDGISGIQVAIKPA